MSIHGDRYEWFLAAMAIATFVGSSPVLAQSFDPDVGSGNIVAGPSGETDNGASLTDKAGNVAQDPDLTRPL